MWRRALNQNEHVFALSSRCFYFKAAKDKLRLPFYFFKSVPFFIHRLVAHVSGARLLALFTSPSSHDVRLRLRRSRFFLSFFSHVHAARTRAVARSCLFHL